MKRQWNGSDWTLYDQHAAERPVARLSENVKAKGLESKGWPEPCENGWLKYENQRSGNIGYEGRPTAALVKAYQWAARENSCWKLTKAFVLCQRKAYTGESVSGMQKLYGRRRLAWRAGYMPTLTSCVWQNQAAMRQKAGWLAIHRNVKAVMACRLMYQKLWLSVAEEQAAERGEGYRLWPCGGK